jgi:hypothetical protein
MRSGSERRGEERREGTDGAGGREGERERKRGTIRGDCASLTHRLTLAQAGTGSL